MRKSRKDLLIDITIVVLVITVVVLTACATQL